MENMMNIITTVLFSFLFGVNCEENLIELNYINPEVYMNTTEVIQMHGYPFEDHKVVTLDSYILSLHRIPFGLYNNHKENRPVVFLQHGLLDSSFTWINNGPNNSLGFILAENGFDVWMGNSRGNVYSKSHEKISNKKNDFWDFSGDEMAKYDLPASIDYIIEKTKVKKLTYIGHSQGTAIAFAKLSQYSKLNSKISSMIAYAPIAYIGHVKSAIRYLSYIAGPLDMFYETFTHGEFLPSNRFMQLLAQYVCGHDYTSTICSNILFLLAGYDTSNFNFTRLPIYISHNPAGTSSKNMAHMAQSYKSNEFKMYDYGLLRNLYYYKSISPPSYHANTNGIPVAIFWGGNDWLSVPEDVSRAIDELGEDVHFRKFIPKYNHMDFIWGIDAPEVIYKDTLKFIFQYI